MTLGGRVQGATVIFRSRRIGAWRSLVARLLWEQEAGGSNPSAPTNVFSKLQRNNSHRALLCQHSVNEMAQLALRRVTRPPCSYFGKLSKLTI